MEEWCDSNQLGKHAKAAGEDLSRTDRQTDGIQIKDLTIVDDDDYPVH